VIAISSYTHWGLLAAGRASEVGPASTERDGAYY
jgi:hypothetical protein